MKCLVSVILIENIQYDEYDVKHIMDQLNCFDAFKQVRPDLINLTTMVLLLMI